MLNLVHAIRSSLGWKRRFIAFASGALGALALAPSDFVPAIAIPLVVSVLLLDGLALAHHKSRYQEQHRRDGLRPAFALGWWIGFGYFVAGLWWLGAAFLVEAEEFAWALPLGIVGLPAVLACFTGAGFMAAHVLWSPGPSRILSLALALGLSEWARGMLFTGFPWNSLGMALGGNLVLGQVASLVGLNGLTFLTILIFASPAVVLSGAAERSWRTLVASLSLLAGIAAFGAIRLAFNETRFDEGVSLRIMQPNTPQDEKFRPENRDRILAHYLRLSSKATEAAPRGLGDVTHLVWPESAFPFFLARDPAALSAISEVLGATVLITGAARMETLGADGLPGEIRKVSYFNAIQVVGPGGLLLDSYDKVHLVPFGEYLPLSGLLEKIGLRQFVHIPGGFEAGSERKLLHASGLPLIFPLVCYEAVFPGVLDPRERKSAGLIVNVTNDGWFGRTAGPYQHLAQARLRSIEEGLPLVRSANTGISAAIDPYGRILAKVPLGAEDVIDTHLPQAIAPPVFARAPLLAPLMTYVVGAIFLILFRIRR